jgi:hypothetical protein
MTGFKSGASNDDPLASEETDQDELKESSDLSTSVTEPETESTSTANTGSTTLPWLYRRNSITDGREKTVQLHLQQSTLDAEHEALRDVPIQETIQKADLREAAYLVGMQHLDEIAEQLRQWGYDYE